MKRFSLLCALALTLCAVATANIIPNNTSITGPGPYTWTYSFHLSQDQNVVSGTAPNTNPVPHMNLTFGGFLTIYDFNGYVNGSCAGPAGWTCTAQNTGFTPDDTLPVDNAGIVNITWAYTSGPTQLGQPNGLNLGNFTAQSIFNTPTLVSYTSRGLANTGPQVGTIADNVGNTQGPTSGVPEPASLGLLGAGLTLLGALRRRVRTQVG